MPGADANGRRARGGFGHIAAALLVSAGLASTPARAHAEPPTDDSPASEPAELDSTDPGASEEHPTPVLDSTDPDAAHRRSWAACAPGITPCTRPRPARAVLLSLGLLGGGVASALMFGLGDRLTQADPALLLAGIGGLAGAGAIAGAIAGRLGADGPVLSDRLRPSTASLAYGYSGPQLLDETPPYSLSLRVAPNLFFPDDHGRLRLFGHVGGWLTPVREVDPRPQNEVALPGQEGTAPRVLRQRHLSVGVGLDLAVALPYPLLRRSARLGAAEIRYRPEVQIRRDHFAPGTPQSRLLERTMLLPLTVGARWILSPRQRFTVYFGPRFDFVSFSDPGSDALRRGGTQIGPLFGEAWYDVDVPLTPRARADGHPRRVEATGQLTLGYVHSRFDGQGLNFGPVIGFLGPIHVGWSTRLRPAGAPLAAQLGAFARIGSGTSVGLELGLVAPDLHYGRKRSR